MHGYIAKSITNDPITDHKTSKLWTGNKDVFYIRSIYFCYQRPRNCYEKMAKWRKVNPSNIITDARCRLCKRANEDIIHIIASCPLMSVCYYLLLRHDVIAKIVYNTLILKIPS